ncbi:uncharacterized protein LOC143919145 [Arctopsyche grandis]|uniref:uncharacterized protein LOC143919145 n=1 Tax=Arctopsyche grandis TaxID=121162 RepID=UPI00406D636A
MKFLFVVLALVASASCKPYVAIMPLPADVSDTHPSIMPLPAYPGIMPLPAPEEGHGIMPLPAPEEGHGIMPLPAPELPPVSTFPLVVDNEPAFLFGTPLVQIILNINSNEAIYVPAQPEDLPIDLTRPSPEQPEIMPLPFPFPEDLTKPAPVPIDPELLRPAPLPVDPELLRPAPLPVDPELLRPAPLPANPELLRPAPVPANPELLRPANPNDGIIY